MSWRRALRMGTACAVLLVGPRLAAAASTEYELLEPPPAPEAGLSLESPQLLDGVFAVGGLLQLERDPVVLAGDGGSSFIHEVVNARLQFRLLGSVRIFNLLQLGADLPMTLRTNIQFFDEPERSHTSLNDMLLRAKAPIYTWHEGRRWFLHTGLSVAAKLPTGDDGIFGGSRDRFLQPTVRLLTEFERGPISARLNLGYAERDDTDIDRFNLGLRDRLIYGVGWGIEGVGKYDPRYFVEWSGSTQVDQAFGSAQHDASELMGGVQLHINHFIVTPGIALGLTKAFGVPAWRMIVAAWFAPRQLRDPKVPAYEPRPSVFGELRVLVETTMPTLAEGVTIVADAVGRTVTDHVDLDYPSIFVLRQGPVLVRATGPYAMAPEVSAVVPAAGVTHVTLQLELLKAPPPPEPAKFRADIIDDKSAEPISAGTVKVEDFQFGTQYTEPFTAGTWHAVFGPGKYRLTLAAPDYFPSRVSISVDWNEDRTLIVPLPKRGKEKVVVTESDIYITDKIFFATASDKILPESFPILDDLAKVLQDHPEIKRVKVSGHTDSRGSREYNLGLSKARARSVFNYLVRNGIDAGRLESEGYGPDRPIDTNDTEDGRANNRRVEFEILERQR